MQSALALDESDETSQPGPELVTTPATAPGVPEQLPLIRMLEVVRDRVESIHAGQRAVAADLRDIRLNLPLQRRPLSKRSMEIHVQVIARRRNGICPCCQIEPVCTEGGRLDGAEFDHWYSRNQNRVTQTWLVCGKCNRHLLDTDFKAAARSAFEAYQQALRPFMGSRQIPLILSAEGMAS
jgi:hypothetical protein